MHVAADLRCGADRKKGGPFRDRPPPAAEAAGFPRGKGGRPREPVKPEISPTIAAIECYCLRLRCADETSAEPAPDIGIRCL